MAAQDFILAIDQGTTGSTVLIVDVSAPHKPSVIGQATVDFRQYYPKTGWVEHDLDEIWHSVQQAAKRSMEQAAKSNPRFEAKRLAAIGITNQRETLCVYARKTMAALHKGIVWQCKRSTDICSRLKNQGLEQRFKDKTGLVLDPYFTGTKISWLMENNPELAAQLRQGQAVAGTIDTFIAARLTSGVACVTEASNASRTLVYDINTGRWDQELLELLGIPSCDILAEVKDSVGLFGKTKGLDFLPDGIPITGILGDQQAALAGQTCFEVGEAKCTFGTGAFLLLNLGQKPLRSRYGMLTTVAWSLNAERTYAFEGAAFVAGAASQFLRDQLGIIAHASEIEALAGDQIAAPEVYFVPALAGLGAPYWDPRAQGAVFGMTRGTTRGQLARAALEGIAFQVCDLLHAMRQDFGSPVSVLRADGGAAANNLLMQAQADLAGLTVDRPQNLETTAMGAALFAGLGAGIYANFTDLKNARQADRLFTPTGNSGDPTKKSLIEQQLAGWQRAVRAVQVFAGTV